MVDEEGDQFVAYFLPTDETRQKRKDDIVEGLEYDPDSTYDYKQLIFYFIRFLLILSFQASA